MATNYRELTKIAKELGLKYIGISEENLIKAIAEAEKTKTPEVTASASDSTEPTNKVKEVKEELEDYNTAVVMDGKKEIRRYTVESHGEDFKSMAHDFADKRGYIVALKDEKSALICPHCGGKIYRSE